MLTLVSPQNKPQGYDGWRLDLLKLLLAVMIVMLHTYAIPDVLYPLLTVAVPIFFMISSYLFWKKLHDIESIPKAVCKFVKRDLSLYLFWIVVMIIPIVFINRWFMDGVSPLSQIVLIVRDFLFWEIFPASWFLMALPLGMLIISLLVYKFKLSNRLLFILSFVTFSVCWLEGFVDVNSDISSLLSPIKTVIPYLSNSFISSLFWIVIGKLIADSNLASTKTPYVPWLIPLFAILLILEGRSYSGNYITTALLSISIFIFVLQINENKKKDFRWCRKASIIIYCSHKTICILINTCFRQVGIKEISGIRLFLVTLFISSLLAFCILFWTSHRHPKFLEYAY